MFKDTKSKVVSPAKSLPITGRTSPGYGTFKKPDPINPKKRKADELAYQPKKKYHRYLISSNDITEDQFKEDVKNYVKKTELEKVKKKIESVLPTAINAQKREALRAKRTFKTNEEPSIEPSFNTKSQTLRLEYPTKFQFDYEQSLKKHDEEILNKRLNYDTEMGIALSAQEELEIERAFVFHQEQDKDYVRKRKEIVDKTISEFYQQEAKNRAELIEKQRSELSKPSQHIDVIRKHNYIELEKTLNFNLSKETKVHDVSIDELADEKGLILPVNGKSLLKIDQGIASDERSGFAIAVKNIELKLKLSYDIPRSSILDETFNPCSRLMLIIDLQPKNTAVLDVLTARDLYEFPAAENTQRFKIIFDRTFVHNVSSRYGIIETVPLVVGTETISNTRTVAEQTTRTSMFIDEEYLQDELVTFKTDAVANANALTNVNYFLIAFGDIEGTTVYNLKINGTVRVSFKDI